jgi:hypothetical protein
MLSAPNSTENQSMKLNDWIKKVDELSVLLDKLSKITGPTERTNKYSQQLDEFLAELESSSLLPREKYEVLKHGMSFNRTICSHIARHGEANTTERLFNLIELLLKSGITHKEIASLLAMEDGNGVTFPLLVASYQNSTNYLRCLTLIQKLVERVLIVRNYGAMVVFFALIHFSRIA